MVEVTKLEQDVLNHYQGMFAAAKNPKERDAVYKNLVNALRAVNVNSAVAKAFEDMAALGPDALKTGMNAVMTLAQQKASKSQDLEKERELLLMQLNSAPAQSRSKVASLFVTIAVFARAMGFGEFADSLEKSAAEEMAKIPHEVKVGTNIANGSTEMTTALAGVTAMLANNGVVTAGAVAAVKGQKEVGQADVFPALNQGSADPRAAKQKITWDTFHDNMKSAGVDEKTLKQMQKIFTKTTAEAGDSNAMDDPLEVETFLRKIKNAPQQDQEKIKAWLHTNVTRQPA